MLVPGPFPHDDGRDDEHGGAPADNLQAEICRELALLRDDWARLKDQHDG